MSAATTALRRSLVLLVVAAAVGGAISWWRARSATPVPAAPPQWPDFANVPSAAAATWKPANADGSTPEGHPIKLKAASGIFHVPGGRFYDRTKPDRCYATATDAEADGYRPAVLAITGTNGKTTVTRLVADRCGADSATGAAGADCAAVAAWRRRTSGSGR